MAKRRPPACLARTNADEFQAGGVAGLGLEVASHGQQPAGQLGQEDGGVVVEVQKGEQPPQRNIALVLGLPPQISQRHMRRLWEVVGGSGEKGGGGRGGAAAAWMRGPQ